MSSVSEEKKLAAEAREFSGTVARNPTDQNIRDLSEMVSRVMAMTANKDVESQARLTITILSGALKFKTIDRRLKEMPYMSHAISRLVHIER